MSTTLSPSPTSRTSPGGAPGRWAALLVLCLGDLMIVLDSSIVNVALPSIQADLGFTQSALAWVVNGYLLTFGGFLLLSGRLGDLLGNKRVFLGGIVAFTVASVACGLAPNGLLLVVGRAVQGVGGAAVSAVALSLIIGLFTDPGERARAMGIFGFVMSGGGAVGVVLGGFLTGVLSWHAIFLVNVPIGVGVWLAAQRVLPADEAVTSPGRLDTPGAVLVTSALVASVYGVVHGGEQGWTSATTVVSLVAGAALMVAFVLREARVTDPLVPLRLLARRNVWVAQVVGVLWTAAMFAWFFLAALYLQKVLGYDAVDVGLAFVPSSVVMALFSLKVSDRLVMRFGFRAPLTAGLLVVTASLALLSRAPVDGSYTTDVLPSMILLGIGAGIAINPLLLAAMGDVEQHESGLASGIVNTSIMMGGAVGLAALVTVSSQRTDGLLADGLAPVDALNGGLQLAFLVGAVAAGAAALVAGTLLRPVAAVAEQPGEPTDPVSEGPERLPAAAA